MVAIKRLHEAALKIFRSEAAILADLKHFAIFPSPARSRSSRACARRRQRTGGQFFPLGIMQSFWTQSSTYMGQKVFTR
jgi:hypothetical protein